MMNKPKSILKVLNMFLFTILCVALVSEAKAQSNQYKRSSTKKKSKNSSSKKTSKKKSSSGKLDISDLEKKYWAPKDTDFSVVQNRTYSKAKKYVVSAQYAMPINNSYSDGHALMLSGSYFFNERHGVEVTYQDYTLKDSQLVDEFLILVQNNSKLKPNHGKVDSYYGVGYSWVPVYAKVSLLSKKIVYMDIAITPHIGMTTYDQQLQVSKDSEATYGKSKTAFTYGFDVTQYFFIDKHIALRMDFRNKYFSEEVLKYNDASLKVIDKTTTNTTLSFGVSVYF